MDDISVHFRKQISKTKFAPSGLGAIPNWKPVRIARHSEWDTTRRYTAITSASPFRMGFTNAGHKHGSPYERVPPRAQDYWKVFALFVKILKLIPLRKPSDFMPNLTPNLKICLFVTKCPWGFILSVTVRGNVFIAKQNRLSATARVFGTFAEVLGAKGFFKLYCSQHRRSGPL